jgi:CDP-glucose 4,6-dehydratase
MSVLEVVKKIKKYWEKLEYTIDSDPDQLHEAHLLKLDCSKAHSTLGWVNVWGSDMTVEKTVKWYKSFYEKNQTIQTKKDLNSYIACARNKKIKWSI